jgi:hypothetical protein
MNMQFSMQMQMQRQAQMQQQMMMSRQTAMRQQCTCQTQSLAVRQQPQFVSTGLQRTRMQTTQRIVPVQSVARTTQVTQRIVPTQTVMRTTQATQRIIPIQRTTQTVAQVSRPTLTTYRTTSQVYRPQVTLPTTQIVSRQALQQQYRVTQLQTMLRRQVTERQQSVTTTRQTAHLTRTTNLVRPPAITTQRTTTRQITATSRTYAPTQHVVHQTSTPNTTSRLTAVTQRTATQCQKQTVQLRVSMTARCGSCHLGTQGQPGITATPNLTSVGITRTPVTRQPQLIGQPAPRQPQAIGRQPTSQPSVVVVNSSGRPSDNGYMLRHAYRPGRYYNYRLSRWDDYPAYDWRGNWRGYTVINFPGTQSTQPMIMPVPVMQPMLNQAQDLATLNQAQLQALTRLVQAAQNGPAQPGQLTAAQVDGPPEVTALTGGPSRVPASDAGYSVDAPEGSKPQVDVASRPPSLAPLK